MKIFIFKLKATKLSMKMLLALLCVFLLSLALAGCRNAPAPNANDIERSEVPYTADPSEDGAEVEAGTPDYEDVGVTDESEPGTPTEDIETAPSYSVQEAPALKEESPAPYFAHGYDEDFEDGRFRPIFYDLPAPFVDLIGAEVYLDWHTARSREERENENVAVSFIRDFNISKEDFTKANEQLLHLWLSIGVSPRDSSMFELYPVDLIFTFDNAAINEFFLWENSPILEEKTMGNTTP